MLGRSRCGFNSIEGIVKAYGWVRNLTTSWEKLGFFYELRASWAVAWKLGF